MSPKVSIIVTARNYGRWLGRALDSALGQNYDNFEVVVVDDGSTDDTPAVLKAYAGNPRLKVVTLDGVGLAAASNRGIAQASGEYVVRLDADDYFDENLVLVEAGFLDRNPDVGLVFCDYHTVDALGEIIDYVRRNPFGDELELLDRPPLAAGAMYRRACYDAIGGYNEALRFQEDYDFWIRFIERYTVRNVSVPLMYYRQHGDSMSRNFEDRMRARREVKKRFVAENRNGNPRRVLGVVPARDERLDGQVLALLPVGGRTLLQRRIEDLRAVAGLDRIVVSTESPEIAAAAIAAGAEVPFLRDKASASPAVAFDRPLVELLGRLEADRKYVPDVVAVVIPQFPFLRADHVAEAIDSLLIYNTDTVLAVVEDLTFHWSPGRTGLAPVGYQRRVVRQEKDIIYKEVGGLYVAAARGLRERGSLIGERVGHIEVAPHEALRIQSPYEYWIAGKMAAEWLKS